MFTRDRTSASSPASGAPSSKSLMTTTRVRLGTAIRLRACRSPAAMCVPPPTLTSSRRERGSCTWPVRSTTSVEKARKWVLRVGTPASTEAVSADQIVDDSMDPETSVTRIRRQSADLRARLRNTGFSGITWIVPSAVRRAVARLARSVRGRSSLPPGRRVGRASMVPVRAGRSRVASWRVSSSTRWRTRGRSAARRASGRPPAYRRIVRSSSTEGVVAAGSSSARTSCRPVTAAAARTSSRTPGPKSAASSSDHSRTPGNDGSRPPRDPGPPGPGSPPRDPSPCPAP